MCANERAQTQMHKCTHAHTHTSTHARTHARTQAWREIPRYSSKVLAPLEALSARELSRVAHTNIPCGSLMAAKASFATGRGGSILAYATQHGSSSALWQTAASRGAGRASSVAAMAGGVHTSTMSKSPMLRRRVLAAISSRQRPHALMSAPARHPAVSCQLLPFAAPARVPPDFAAGVPSPAASKKVDECGNQMEQLTAGAVTGGGRHARGRGLTLQDALATRSTAAVVCLACSHAAGAPRRASLPYVCL